MGARSQARSGARTLLVVTDVEALLPAASPPPLATLVLDALHDAVATPGLALVATTAAPEAVDPRLRAPELVDRELRLALPDLRTRVELLRRLLTGVPLAEDVDLRAVAERAPGFVAADLVAVRREAAVLRPRCARTATPRHPAGPPRRRRLGPADLDVVLGDPADRRHHPRRRRRHGRGQAGAHRGRAVAAAATRTRSPAWASPRRAACCSTGRPAAARRSSVRALAGTGQLNVLAVKGAELLDKWVGESERAVRELFRRARDAAPALVFLDEIDALAPRRGQSSDRGVADRVVAALLTELDGAQPLRDVVVVGATNRPELIDPALLRPGRLERLVYVPPPDAAAARRDPAGRGPQHPARPRRRPGRARRRAGRLLRRRLRRAAPRGRPDRDAASRWRRRR